MGKKVSSFEEKIINRIKKKQFYFQTPKKSQFTLKRKKNTKPADDWGDLVCPMGASGEFFSQSSISQEFM